MGTLRVRSNFFRTLCIASSESFNDARAIAATAEQDASSAKVLAIVTTCLAAASAQGLRAVD